MMRLTHSLCHTVGVAVVVTISVSASLAGQASNQAPPSSEGPAQLVAEGQKLSTAGDQTAALSLYRRALQADPNFVDAHVATAVALDLAGQYDEARSHLAKAISGSQADSIKTRALRTMAVSYAFTRDGADAAKAEQQVIDAALAKQDFVGAADVDNELARIYLESGDVDNAFKVYQTGHQTVLRKSNLTQPERDLWDFRWEHAQARIAARRGQRDDAAKHVAAAKAILDRGTNPDQARFFPYLTGYVALYTGDFATAIADLQHADQHDPFILSLMAQAYEKSGDKAHAMGTYRQVLTINTHNPPNAFARPLAKQKVASSF
jgi:tetratricopeptide (TPR) repeat protein